MDNVQESVILLIYTYYRHKLLYLILIRIAGLRYDIRTRNFPEYEGTVSATKQWCSAYSHCSWTKSTLFSLHKFAMWHFCKRTVREEPQYLKSSEGGGASRPTIPLFDKFHQSVLFTWGYRGPRSRCTVAELCLRVQVMPTLCPHYILYLIM
jgi:hypothetical protein